MESLKPKYTVVHIQDSKSPGTEYLEDLEEVKTSGYWNCNFAGDEYDLIFFKENGKANTSYFGSCSDYPDGLPVALMAAYISEYDVIVSPDDMWVTILHGFYSHVNANAEKLRHLFVDHKGKAKIEVTLGHDFTPADAETAISLFVEGAKGCIKGDVKALMECNFTTSGEIEKTVSSVIMLGVLQNYFSFSCTACGVRNVLFKGTLSDWELLRKKVEGLGKYELEWWIPQVLEIVDNFIKTFKGDPNKIFWNKMMNLEGEGESGEYDEITGWIKTFYPYNVRGERHTGPLFLNEIPRITFKVPFDVSDSNGHREMLYAAGFSGLRVEGEAFVPVMGYALLKRMTEEEKEAKLKKEEEERLKEEAEDD